MLKYFSVFFFMLSIAASPKAQDVVFQAVVSKNTVAEGERFRIEYKLNAAGDQFAPPRFEGLRILSGPNQSTNMQFINGRSSYSISYSYVLMALKEGDFRIGAAAIKVGSEIIHSDEIVIKVVKGNSPPQSQQPQQKQQIEEETAQSSDDLSKNLFITASVSNSKPYVGQTIIATYKLYFNYNIVDNSFTTLPGLTGFWSEDLDVQNNARETEVINGVRYNVAYLKKSVLIPQRPGELNLDPLEMDLVIQQPVQSRSRNLFDQFFGNFKNVKVSVRSKPVKVQVLPLPSGKPSDFSGAVGNYKIKLTADRNKVKANEAINISYEISGNGNLKLLDEKDIDFPADFEVYDPKVNDNITVSAGGMSGSRTYNYLVIPRVNGEFNVGPLSFTYFDPSGKKYNTVKSSTLQFEVAKGEEDGKVTATFSSSDKEEIKLLGSDIRYIKTNTVLLPAGHQFFGSIWYYLLWLLPIPLFFVIRQIRISALVKLSDKEYMRRSKANKMAVRRLSVAKGLLGKDDKKFYEEVFRALYGFFGDKFNLPTSELNKDSIRDKMASAGISEKLIEETTAQLSRCEMARFAPVTGISHEEVYNGALGLLSNLQKSLRK